MSAKVHVERPADDPASLMQFNLRFDQQRVAVPQLLEALDLKSWPVPGFRTRYQFSPEQYRKVRARIAELIHAGGGELTLKIANSSSTVVYRSDGQTLTCHLPGAVQP